MDLTTLQSHELREAVRTNRVSFPSQAPTWDKQSRCDIQWRLAVLYFVRGWSLFDIAHRYGLSRERAGQIVRAWRILSVKHGYIQEIPAGESAANIPAYPLTVPMALPELLSPDRAMSAAGGLYRA
ncbi:MAG: hypothetical protein ABSB15_13715 [Bryobacteraceae bacterium]|jgi:hypothetical protein